MYTTEVQLQPDKELAALLKQGSEPAFNAIYKRYSAKLYHAAYNLLRNKEVCEDLVQELFVDLWSKRNTLEIQEVRPYLYRSAVNRALMVLRAGKITLDLEAVEMLISEHATDDLVIDKDMRKSIELEIAALPEKCREVFILSRKEQLSHKEIASQLNISVKTVENHLTRALKSLRASLGDFLFLALILLSNIY
ncbi:RNA polymerase sigma-70 factor [Chitinophaga sp. SYP-B3965]|uniref:RNA polymerase sigma-70 factor n=1 Tax=Chitinophaga sp. SYP-B3965 TaxID=2663120 RepID=UPI001299E300|nr:RNA polymerase sigma-70 factor [Chitinophaga sp. SYP-B3965]MRG48037.1 RNA polymerase sigma-70 factor [Chitinophaga sp. SYP-B3965]